MKRRRHTPEQVIRQAGRGREAPRRGQDGRGGGPAPRDHRVDLAPLAEPVRRDEGRRRQAAEGARAARTQRLKKIVADQALDIDMLKELNRGNF